MITLNHSLGSPCGRIPVVACFGTGLEILALTGLAATAAGAGVTMSANADAQEEMNKKANQELMRQKDYEQQARKKFQAQVADTGRPQTDKSQAAAEQNRLAEQAAMRALPIAGSAAAPAVPAGSTGGDSTVESKRTQDYIQGRAAAQAQLGAFNESNLDTRIKNLRSLQELGLIAEQAGFSNRVLPYELQAASHSADNMKALGSMLSTGGSIAGMVGGLGGALGWLGSSAAPAAAGAGAAEVTPSALNAMSQSALQGYGGAMIPGAWTSGAWAAPAATAGYAAPLSRAVIPATRIY